jgi:hypothetical protein
MTEDKWIETFVRHVRALRPEMAHQPAQAIGLQQWARYRDVRSPERAAVEWAKEVDDNPMPTSP